jgi:NADPH:quinone reductase-like Zn-dependent oxidoreductase
MKAVILTKFGSPDVLKVGEVEKPKPKENEILIKIHSTSVNFADLLIRDFKSITPRKFNMPFLFWLFGKMYFGFYKPKVKILGSEFSGEVEAVGEKVKRFQKGESVFAYTGPRMGAYSEYICMKENDIVSAKPANMTYAEAASVPYGAIMALNLIRKLKIKAKHKVLVIGASGGIGPAVVQLAKYYGAYVNGICGTQRLEFVKNLGADKVIDYTNEDFTKSTEKYDFIIDILGKCSFKNCKKVLNTNGSLIYVSFKSRQIFQMILTSLFSKKKAKCLLSAEKQIDLINIKELIETGKIKTFIDKSYPLNEAAEAHRFVEKGNKKGNIVINVTY